MSEIIEEDDIVRDPINAPAPEVRPYTDEESSFIEQFLKKSKKRKNKEPRTQSKPESEPKPSIEAKKPLEINHDEYMQLFEEQYIPKRSRAEVAQEYNTKLFAYWMDQLDDSLSIMRKKQIISLFMFGHTDRHELFKNKESA